MQEISAPLAQLPDDPLATVANPEFPVVLRGYDRMAVDAFVKHTAQLVAELSTTRSPEAAIRRALERVGGEVSSILQRAHDTAEEITARSRSEAEDRLAAARHEADELIKAAERRVQELDVEVDRIWGERDRIVGDVRKLSEELELLAGAAATRFPAAAPDETAALGPDETQALRPDETAALGPDETHALRPEETGALGPDETHGVGPEETAALGPDETHGLRPEETDALGQDETRAFWPRETEALGPEEREGMVEPTDSVADPPTGAGPDTVEQPPVAGEPTQSFSDPPEGVAEPPFAPGQVSVPEPPDDEPTIVKSNVAGVRRPRELRVIDLLHLGRERVIGCWQVEEVLIDPGPSSCLVTLLDALGDVRPRALLLTHIHLDHAGAAGSLAERWPDLEVYVHERGAPHLMDPTKLLDSAHRLYGQEMERLWGEVLPVPVENVRILRGGEQLLDRAFEVAYTPGHASHHVAYMHEGTAFVGDTAGVRIVPEGLTIPPTPPPDIDVEAWHASIERVKAWRPERLAVTHFGSTEDVEAQLAEVSERLDNWAALARTEELDTFIATAIEEIKRGAGSDLLPAYTQAAAPEQTYAGLRRYWDQRAQPEHRAPAEASTHAGRFSRPGGSGSPEVDESGEVS